MTTKSTETNGVAMSTFRTFQLPRLEELEPSIFVARRDLPRALLAVEADTLGWDTVNAIRLPHVNEVMKAKALNPGNFSKEVQAGWSVAGEFDPWYMVRGGSGAIVFIRTPIRNAKMTFPGSPDLDIPSGFVSISIKLQYLPQPPGADGSAAGEPAPEEQQWLARSVEARGPDDPAVVIQNVDYGSVTPDSLQDALFRGAMASWFNSNLAAFTYWFTEVNLNARADRDAFQWLKPTYTSYAYFNGIEDETSYFGVLNMTENNSPEGLSNQLPPSAIPADCEASLIVSNRSFLRNMVVPGLPKTFKNATVSDFKLTDNNTLIENLNSLRLEDIKVGAIYYTPEVLAFRLQIVGDEIQVYTKTKVNVSPGIDVFAISTDYYRLRLVNKPEGGQTLDWVQSRDPQRQHWYEKADWVVVTEIIIGIIGAVVGIILGGTGVIASIVKRIIACIIIAVVAGLVAAIPAIIAAVMDGKAAEALPSIGHLVTEATGDIQWPESSGFLLKTVELNGSFVMGGDLQPTQEG